MKGPHRVGVPHIALRALFLVSCLVPLGAAVTAAQSIPPPEADPNAVSGTIAIHGCDVTADELLVRARPIYPPSPIFPPSPVGPTTTGESSASLVAGAAGAPRSIVVKTRSLEGGSFGFLFTGLTPGVPYRLGVKLVGNSQARCEKMAWDVPADPLVTTGTAGITFDGYAVKSRLEVWGEAVGARTTAAWVSADALDFDDPVAAVRTFRWRSLDADVTGGQLQVSTVPFPHGENGRYAGPCSADDSRLVYKHDFNASAGDWSTISVDFNAIVYGDRSPGDVLPAGDAVIGPGVGRAGLGADALTRLNLGRPLYVRVMPLKEGTILCGADRGVPAEAALAKLIMEVADLLSQPQFSVSNISYTPPKIGARPKSGETCYRMTERRWVRMWVDSGWTPWDSLVAAHMSGVDFHDWAEEGWSFCVPNESDDDGWFESFVDGFGDVLAGMVDVIGDLVNAASGIWEKIQDYAVKAVASGLSAIPGVECNELCQGALEMGLEVALATMGVPPSLPNFDQLLDQGADYLAAQVASQYGVPEVLTDYASDEAQKFVKQAVKDMKDRTFGIPKLPGWLVPDLRFDPAYLVMELSGTGIPLPSRPGLIRSNDPIFVGRFVQLPSKLPKPGESPLLFPMVLDPNTWGLPPAPSNYSLYDAARWDKARWIEQRYTNGCYHLFMVGLAPIGKHVFEAANQFLSASDGSPCTPKLP